MKLLALAPKTLREILVLLNLAFDVAIDEAPCLAFDVLLFAVIADVRLVLEGDSSDQVELGT